MLKEEVEEDKESQEDFKDFEYPTDYLKEGERAHENDESDTTRFSTKLIFVPLFSVMI
ncbi:hypothetical protein Anas_07625 [Armadillidium nasatum]|uniref:Uncharacterized protein n=1 Tax=Armadillidium nasatum TaxID=96803 RepID=A0A5N5TME0_9CRUS|nr:hypothetical protein Anas_07625 [Armadillidium nasatum]